LVPSGRNDGTAIALGPENAIRDSRFDIIGTAWESSDRQEVKLIRTAIGMISSVLHLLKESPPGFDASMVPVGTIMKRDPVSVGPTMHTLKAIEVMRRYNVGCLPVVHLGRLVGMVTVDEFVHIAGELLEEKLSE